MARKSQPPPRTRCRSATVRAVVGWSREFANPQSHAGIKCDAWEVIVPEFVFEPDRLSGAGLSEPRSLLTTVLAPGIEGIFLMAPVGAREPFGPETAATVWVDLRRARALVSLNQTTAAGRARDLAVINALAGLTDAVRTDTCR